MTGETCIHNWKIQENKKIEKEVIVPGVGIKEKVLVISQKIKCDKCGLEELRGFAQQILPEDQRYMGANIFSLNPDGNIGEGISRYGTPTKDELKKITLLPEISHPELPVIYITASGDEEGRSTKHLGYHNGRIENVLRAVAPRAIYMPPRFNSDYEADVSFYDPEQAGKVLTWNPWEDFKQNEQEYTNKIISYIPNKPVKGIKVAVHISKKEADKFAQHLATETKYEKIKWLSDVVFLLEL